MFVLLVISLTILHESPVIVKLLRCLQEVAAISPQASGRVCDYSGAGRTGEPGDESSPFIVGCQVFALHKKYGESRHLHNVNKIQTMPCLN